MSEAGLDVAACVERVRRGDEEAARALLVHLQPTVAKLVRAHLPRRTAEEDMMQAVFVKVFTKLDQYSGKVPLEHWVSRVAINACISQIEKERVRPEVRWSDLSEEEEAVLSHLSSTAAELAPDHQLASAQLVEKLLQSLPPADRLLVTWLHMEGRPMKDICAQMGWSLPLVKVRAFRARQRLKKELKKLLREKI